MHLVIPNAVFLMVQVASLRNRFSRVIARSAGGHLSTPRWLHTFCKKRDDHLQKSSKLCVKKYLAERLSTFGTIVRSLLDVHSVHRHGTNGTPPYVTEFVKDGKPIYKLTSEWNRWKNDSNGKPLSKHHARKMCQLHNMKTEPAEGAPSSQQIYEKHFDHRVQKVTDWITELGGPKAFLFILYGCTNCDMWTVGSNHWYRAQRLVAELTDESTTLGEKVGSWRCCLCFDKFIWAKNGPHEACGRGPSQRIWRL